MSEQEPMKKGTATERAALLREMVEEQSLEARYRAYCRLIALHTPDLVIYDDYPMNQNDLTAPVSLEDFAAWEREREERDRRVVAESRRDATLGAGGVDRASKDETALYAARLRLRAANRSQDAIIIEPGDPSDTRKGLSSPKAGSRGLSAWLKRLFGRE